MKKHLETVNLLQSADINELQNSHILLGNTEPRDTTKNPLTTLTSNSPIVTFSYEKPPPITLPTICLSPSEESCKKIIDET